MCSNSACEAACVCTSQTPAPGLKCQNEALAAEGSVAIQCRHREHHARLSGPDTVPEGCLSRVRASQCARLPNLREQPRFQTRNVTIIPTTKPETEWTAGPRDRAVTAARACTLPVSWGPLGAGGALPGGRACDAPTSHDTPPRISDVGLWGPGDWGAADRGRG